MGSGDITGANRLRACVDDIACGRRMRAGAGALMLLLCGAAWCEPEAAAPAVPTAAEPPPAETNLLRLPDAQIQGSTAAMDDAASLSQLADGDPATVVSARTSPGTPVDVVYGFGDLVTAQRLVVQLPDASRVTKVEILVSTVSATAGFRSVRAGQLTAQSGPQEFRFVPAGARWIMLRFTPAAHSDSVDVAEAAVMGYAGAPRSSYAFKQAPAAALEVLKGLNSLPGVDLSISDDERSLFADLADGAPKRWTFEEAALIVSGAHTAEQRAPYLEKLARLENDAASAIGSDGAPFERGAKLLRWLYRRGALKRYNYGQTDLTTLLDSGNYNCVSSALLYMLAARHLGLDVRAIEVPDHAFVMLYDGTRHVDVETTTPDGFDPDADAAGAGRFRRMTGLIRPSTEQPELRREVDGLWLLGAVYYNRGVNDDLARRYSDALGDYFRSLSLDHENASAVKNTLSTIASWGAELAEKKDFAAAVKELSVGLALAPDDALLVYDGTTAWQLWAKSELDAGHQDQALAIVHNAAQAMPASHFEQLETWIYVSPAQKLADHSDWSGAIALVDPARTDLHGQALGDIENYEAWLYNQQALGLVARQDWQAARTVFDAGSRRLPGNAVLRQNTIYCWSRVWVAQAQAGDYPAALASTEQAGARFPDDTRIHQAQQALWLNWSKAVLDTRDWSRGIDICQRGLKHFPGDAKLANNERVGWSAAAQERYEAQDWQGTIDLLVRARARYPQDKAFENNELAMRMNLIQAAMGRDDFGAALVQAQFALNRFPNQDKLLRVRDYCRSRLGKT